MDSIVVKFRAATEHDIDFLSQIFVGAAAASGVEVDVEELPAHPDTYQYIDGFPKLGDVGVVGQTTSGVMVGGAWIRQLPTNAHAINEPLPELTMGVVVEYRRMGIGRRLLEELYNLASAAGISKISLGVHKDNTPAVCLYRRQNWSVDGTFQQYIMMSKCLY